jgi:hypothetical protein
MRIVPMLVLLSLGACGEAPVATDQQRYLSSREATHQERVKFHDTLKVSRAP